jgi:uncharacterized protein
MRRLISICMLCCCLVWKSYGHAAQSAADYRKMGDLAYAKKEYSFAINKYKQALTDTTNAPVLINNMAVSFLHLNKPQATLYYSGQVIELAKKEGAVKPQELASAYYNMGKAYQALVDFPQALSAYEQANALAPNQTRQDAVAKIRQQMAETENYFNGGGYIETLSLQVRLAFKKDGSVVGSYFYDQLHHEYGYIFNKFDSSNRWYGADVDIFSDEYKNSSGFMFEENVFNGSISGSLKGENIQLVIQWPTNKSKKINGKVIFLNNKPAGIVGKPQNGTKKEDNGGAEKDMKLYVGLIELDNEEITCDEMEWFGDVIFRNMDLIGRGVRMASIEKKCAKDLNEVNLLGDLIKKSNFIHQPNFVSPYCKGVMWETLYDQHALELAELGYAPKSYKFKNKSLLTNYYFEEWSYQSIINRKLYLDYIDEKNKVISDLINWYKINHKVDDMLASEYANLVINHLAKWAYGRYDGGWRPESIVSHTDEAIKGNSSNFLTALKDANTEEKLNSLRRLIVHDVSLSTIEILMQSLMLPSLWPRQESALSLAVNKPELISMLLKYGLNPNQQNYFGKTPIFYAIQSNQHESVKALIAGGANVNHKYQLEEDHDCKYDYSLRQWGRTPLMHAAQHADVEMLKILLDAGANIQEKDTLGSMAIDYSKNNNKHENTVYLNENMPAKVDAGAQKP